jgi:hypothetical protein
MDITMSVCHVLGGVKYCNNDSYSVLTISRTVVAIYGPPLLTNQGTLVLFPTEGRDHSLKC